MHLGRPFLVLLFASLFIVQCSPRGRSAVVDDDEPTPSAPVSPEPATQACTTDDDCSPGVCVDNVCAGCRDDVDCSCHETCEKNTCVGIGNEGGELSRNAHGQWVARDDPDAGNGEENEDAEGEGGGAGGLAYAGTCSEDNDCRIGELCNPLTRGCIRAIDYQERCSDTKPCPAGPHGEILACEPTSRRCYPAALCRTDRNCCGLESFVCDTGANVCVAQRLECQPPAEVTSTCPMDPRVTDECPAGLFCSTAGKCVQCNCDGDCDASIGLGVCHQRSGRCVPSDYCETADECPDADKACDLTLRRCVPRCENETQCSSGEFCRDDNVCRPYSELPCTEDMFEPNDSVATVSAGPQAITLPEQGSADTVTTERLSLCLNDEDWFYFDLVRGDRIVVTGQGHSPMSARLKAFGRDGVTELASSYLGSFSTTLDFTANADGPYYVKVEQSSFSPQAGYYSLGFQRLVGEVCIDAREEAPLGSPNDTVDAATPVFDTTVGSASLLEGCTLETTTSNQRVVCGASVLKRCAGDVDYMTFTAPAGADVRVVINQFDGDLDLRLYGPYVTGEAVDTSRLADSEVGYTWGSSLTVNANTREPSTFLVHVTGNATVETNYGMTVTLTPPAQACAEDAYDGAEAGAPTDAPGLNDTVATASKIVVSESAPAVVGGGAEDALRLCRSDVDWFELVVRDSVEASTEATNPLAPLPAGYRVDVQVTPVGTVSQSALSVALMAVVNGPTAEPTLLAGSTSLTRAQRNLGFTGTAGVPTYVVVTGASADLGPVDYALTVTVSPPPACLPDRILGQDGDSNNTPAEATVLTTPNFPAVTGQSTRLAADLTQNEVLSVCAADADWYRFDLDPGHSVSVTVSYDATESELGVGLYSDAVLTATNILPTIPPVPGRVSMSQRDGRGAQYVHGDPGDGGYLLVYNRGGWPITNYDVDIALTEGDCFADVSEPNDTWTEAYVVPLTREAQDPSHQTAYFAPQTLCRRTGESEADWYRVFLDEADQFAAKVHYDPTEGDLDMRLYGPNRGSGVTVQTDTDNWDSTGVLEVEHTIASGKAGMYYLRIHGYSATQNHYDIGFDVRRSCVEDMLEPVGTTGYGSLVWNSDVAGVELLDNMGMCDGEDWLAIDVPAPVAPAAPEAPTDGSGEATAEPPAAPANAEPRQLTACIAFEHADGDLDLQVYQPAEGDAFGGTADTLLAGSLTKTNQERVTWEATADQRFYLRVFLDPRDESKRTTYRLVVLDGHVPCPE